MVPWEGPLPWQEGGKTEPEYPQGHGPAIQELPDTYRKRKIKEAIAEISPNNYGKPVGKYPALPKVGAISFIVGFPVTRDEIYNVMFESKIKRQAAAEARNQQQAAPEEPVNEIEESPVEAEEEPEQEQEQAPEDSKE